MPVYTYRCANCGIQFDQQQKFSDAPLTRCPECDKKTLHKVYQPVGIVFKGSGFYATDHRSPSGQGRASTKDKEGSDKSEPSTPATASTDKSGSSDSSSSSGGESSEAKSSAK